MKRNSMVRSWIWIAAIVVLSAALLPGSARAQPLTVFAAASVKEALDEAAAQYRKAQPAAIATSYAASSALAKQIDNGAPADVFISADLDWMDYIEQRKLVKAGTRFNLLRNRLVMIAPAGASRAIDIKAGFPLAPALGGGRLSIADPDNVPAGKYAKTALEKLGVWDSVKDRIARGENVRAALNFVARGEAPLGIVYRSDALVEKKVRTVGEFPRESHPPIVYPVAIIAASRQPAAGAFVEYLKSSQARAIFEKYGFGTLP